MASQTLNNTTLDDVVTDWYAALKFEDGTIVVADTLTELTAELIPGYSPEQTLPGVVDAFQAREAFAAQQANLRQGLFAVVATTEDDWDVDTKSEDVLTAVFADRATVTPAIATWDEPFPLVVVRTSYYPHSDVLLPDGNIEVIDPTDEHSLLTSLAELGDFELVFKN